MISRRTILSLFDHSGEWSRPYLEAGYDVVRVDLKRGDDVRRLLYLRKKKVHGILIAPPCTDMSSSGAQYWGFKDAFGETWQSLALVDAGLRAVAIYNPVWWVLENPVGRLKHFLGAPAFKFNPCDFGDAYTKKTLLWGRFNVPKKSPVKPERVCSQGSWLMKLGGKSERTKELRSITPAGFARAFFKANP